MCGPKFCSMKITQDVRDYAAKLEAVEIKLVGMDGQQERVVAEVESGMGPRMAETFKGDRRRDLPSGGGLKQAAGEEEAASGAVSPADSSDAPPVVWTIAGSDSGGGAGIQADLHTCTISCVHGCSVISAITAQNSVAVKMVDPVLMQTFTAQIDALSVDLPPAAIKIGLLPTRLPCGGAGPQVVDRRGSLRGLRSRWPSPAPAPPWWRPACWRRCASTCCHVCRSSPPTVPSWKP